MNNSDKFILFSIIVIIGLLIIWGVSFQKDYLPVFRISKQPKITRNIQA